jgi:hypothetical protein
MLMVRRGPLVLAGAAAPSIPDVEFLGAIQVAESNGSDAYTAMSGSYTPPGGTDFVIAVASGRNSNQAISGEAMTLAGNAMTQFGAGAGTFKPYALAFYTSNVSAGTVAFTRTGGLFASLQLVAYAFRHVAGIGAPVSSLSTSSTGPALVAITPTLVGSMMFGVSCNDNGVADGALTPVNLTEAIDLQAPGPSSITATNQGGGYAEVTGTSEVTVGFSWASGTKGWSAHAVELLKAT